MTRSGHTGIACVAMLIVTAGLGATARADCLDWSTADVRDGRIEALPDVGELRYRQAAEAVGFGHHRQALALQWRGDDGRLHAQVVFDRIGSETFPALVPDADGLGVRIVDCAFRGPCRERIAHYGYDSASGRFREAVRWAAFEFDPDDDTWRPAPAPAPEDDRFGDAAACDVQGVFPDTNR